MGQLARQGDSRGPGAWAAAALLVASCALLASAPARGAGVVGTGTAGSCTEAALTAALNGGGLVTFDCGPSSAVIFLSRSTTVAFEPILFVVQDGAALYNSPDGKATLDGVHAQGGPLQIPPSTIPANGLSGLQGVGKPAAAIVNSTITGNTCEGVSHGGVELILNSTIADNNPLGAGTAQVVTSEAVFKNTIVSGTEPNCALLAGGKHISDGFNLSSDASCGFTVAGDQAGGDPREAANQLSLSVGPFEYSR